MKAELAALHRPIEIDAQARLAAAFVFGHAFPLAARVSVTAVHRDGQRWTTSPKPDLSAVSAPPVNTIETGDPRVAVVEVSFGRRVEVESGETVTAHGIAPGRIARIGPRNAACGVDAATAAAAAATFGRVLRGMRDDGVQEAHLFISAPAALVVLLGASVNAGPAMTLYHTAEGRYVPSVRLEA